MPNRALTRPIRSRMLSLQRAPVYRASLELVVVVREVRAACPGGTEPLRRAARSIEQNIADGVGATSPPDTAKFFSIARGSAKDCATHLDALRAEDLVDPTAHEAALVLLARIVAMIR